MSPLIALETWNVRETASTVKPKSRCFVVSEGANTEYWYLSKLARVLSRKNLPETMEICPIQRTGDDKGKSHPHALIEQAETIREDKDGYFGFDRATDRIIIVFDADIYHGDAKKYRIDLDQACNVAEVAVTNPSFELFLLLHIQNAYQDTIAPHSDEILNNSYVEGTHRRYISKLVSEVLGINVKTNKKVADLAEKYEVAVEEERNLNQDPQHAATQLTSNLGKIIEQLIASGEWM